MAIPSTITPQIQTLVLQAGQSGYIPSNATILSIDGTAIVTSNCIDVTPKPLKCYEISYVTTNGAGGTQAWDVGDNNNIFDGIYFGGILKPINVLIDNRQELLNTLVSTSNGAIVPIGVAEDQFGDMRTEYIRFKTSEAVATGLYLSAAITHSNGAIIRIYPKQINC